jgi:hypothetical protein
MFRGDPVSLVGGSPWIDARALWDGILPAAEIGGTLLEGVEPRTAPRSASGSCWPAASARPGRWRSFAARR